MSHIRNRQNGNKSFRDGEERDYESEEKENKKQNKTEERGTAINTFQFSQYLSSLMREVDFFL